MKMKTGRIPENLKFFARPEIDIKFRMDDIEVDDFQKVTKCNPIYVADATNSKTQATGKDWSERNVGREWCALSREWIKTDAKPFTFERANDPISGIRLIGLEHRGNGGRAYKALVLDRYVFDFREDVLLDAILNDGILENGVLPGEYIFASVGSEMKLIRVGSLLHQKMIEATSYWKKDVIGKLEVGGIYQNKIKTAIYLGPVYSRALDVEWHQKSAGYSSWPGSSTYDNLKLPPRSAKLSTERKAHLFVDITHKKNPIESLDDIERISTYGFTYHDKLPKSFRSKVGQIPGDIEDIIQAVKERATSDADSYEIQTLVYYAMTLNVSSKPGFLHPRIAAILTEQ